MCGSLVSAPLMQTLGWSHMKSMQYQSERSRCILFCFLSLVRGLAQTFLLVFILNLLGVPDGRGYTIIQCLPESLDDRRKLRPFSFLFCDLKLTRSSLNPTDPER